MPDAIYYTLAGVIGCSIGVVAGVFAALVGVVLLGGR